MRLRHTTNRGVANVNWQNGATVPLALDRPGSIKKEPAYACPQALYGIMTIGTLAVMPVAVCPESSYTGTAYFDRNRNGDLTDDGAYSYGGVPAQVEVPLQYPEGERPYVFTLWVNTTGPVPTPTSTSTRLGEPTPTPTPAPFGGAPQRAQPLSGTLSFSTYHIRFGFFPGPVPRPVALIDANNDGRFDDPVQDRLVIDVDGDGLADGSTYSFGRTKEHFPLGSAFYVDGQAYKAVSISPSGDEVRFDHAATATLTGMVLGRDTGVPLSGAKVRVEPGGRETTTDSSGRYSLTVLEGQLLKVVVTHEGYIPAVERNRGGVRPGGAVALTFVLRLAPVTRSGTVTLPTGRGYHFLAASLAPFERADFTINWWEGRAHINVSEASGQGGIISLGKVATTLEQVVPPVSGYQFYMQPVEGHTYVVQGQEGEEGRYIIFRITRITDRDTTLEYVYK